MRYTTSELAKLLKQSAENIRKWTQEFSSHLSPEAAQIEKGKHRSYNDDDVSVLALVADCKDRGLVFEQIHKLLDDGERLTPKANPLAMATHQEQVAILQLQIDDVKKQLALESKRADGAEAQNILLERQLAAAQAEIKALNREIGRLEASKGE